ncbi:hypothetical protein PM082_006451 [Marasmius tenuissimus]|nr:hypothetical protein PM082_006451 [Marasmius tenuissimus]
MANLDCDETSGKKVKSLDSKQSWLIPAARLPIELLVTVFIFHVEWILHQAGSAGVTVNIWLGFTQVCQQWRRAALEATFIWACPDFRLPKFVPRMLERSKSAPLTVKVDLDLASRQSNERHIEAALMKTLEQHIEHTAVLHITAPRDTMQRVLSTLRHTPAPMLDTFVLRLPRPRSYDRLRVNPLELPENIFANEIPRLKTVELQEIRLDESYNSAVLRNLTFLNIRFFEEDLAPQKVLAILQNCSKLKELLVRGGSRTTETTQGRALTPVKLSQVRRLEIVGDLPMLSQLVDHIVSFPSLESALLSVCLGTSWSRHDLSQMAKRILNSPKISYPPFLYFSMHLNIAPFATLNFSTRLCEMGAHTTDPVGVILVEERLSNVDLFSCMRTTLEVAPLSGVRTVVVDSLRPIPTDMVAKYFGIRMCTLKGLILLGSATAFSFLDVLGGRETSTVSREANEDHCDNVSGAEVEPEERRYPFQTLRAIGFQSTDFNQYVFRAENASVSPGGRLAGELYGPEFGLVHFLYACLKLRREVSTDITHLIFREACGLTDQVREVLKDVEALGIVVDIVDQGCSVYAHLLYP